MQMHKQSGLLITVPTLLGVAFMLWQLFGNGLTSRNFDAAWIGAGPIVGVLLGLFLALVLPSLSRLLVLVIGRATDATIVEAKFAGGIVRSGSQYNPTIVAGNKTLVFDIKRDDGSTYRAQETVMVPYKSMHSAAPGATLKVKVNPFMASHVAAQLGTLQAAPMAAPLPNSISGVNAMLERMGVTGAALEAIKRAQTMAATGGGWTTVVQNAGGAATPVAFGESSVADALRELKSLADSGIITAQDFETKKAELLKRL